MIDTARRLLIGIVLGALAALPSAFAGHSSGSGRGSLAGGSGVGEGAQGSGAAAGGSVQTTVYAKFGASGAVTGTGRFWLAQTGDEETTAVTDASSNGTKFPSPEAMDIVRAFHVSTAADGTTDFKVHASGVAVATLEATGTADIFTLSVSVAAGEDLSWEYDAGTFPNDANGGLQLISGDEADPGRSYAHYAADMTAAGTFFELGSEFGVLGTSGGNRAGIGSQSTENQVGGHFPALSGGTVTTIDWSTFGSDVTTDFKIHINGVAGATIDLTAGSGGIEGLSQAFSEGDRIAVEFDAGKNPDESWVIVGYERGAGAGAGSKFNVGFGGRPSGVGRFHQSWCHPEATVNTSSGASYNLALSTVAGTIESFVVLTVAADATTVYKIYVSGIVEATVSPSAAEDIIAVSIATGSTTFLSVEFDAGTIPLESLLLLMVTE